MYDVRPQMCDVPANNVAPVSCKFRECSIPRNKLRKSDSCDTDIDDRIMLARRATE